MSAMTNTPAARGALPMTLHGFRFDLRALLRNKRARFFTLFFPVLLLVVLSSVAGGHDAVQDGVHMSFSRFYVPGIITVTLMVSCFTSLVQAVVTRREQGVWKRRRAAAVPAWSLVAGQSMANATIALGSVVVLLVLGKVAYGVGVSAGALIAVGVTVLLSAVCLCATSFALASFVKSADAAQPVTQLIQFPLFFLSAVWFPTDGMPHGLKIAADVFPVAHISGALHQAFTSSSFGDAIALNHLWVIAVWAVVATRVASKRFDWLPARG